MAGNIDILVSGAMSKTSELEEADVAPDDDLLSAATTESRSATPEDLHIDTLSRPLAICVATIFEELSDKLTLVGYSLSTPFADARTRRSIAICRHQLPLLQDSVEPPSNSEKEGWILKQLHATRVPDKLEFLVKPDSESRLSVTDIMKRAGVKTNTQTERNQKIRIQLQLMANSMIRELVLHSTFNSLVKRIDEENNEQEEMFKTVNKVKLHQDYILDMQAAIKIVKMRQVSQRKTLRVDIHNLTDLLLEQNFRSNLEDKYIKKSGLAKVKIVRKSNHLKEKRKYVEFHNMEKSLQLEMQVHESMMTIINQKLQENSDCLDTVVEKYDKDFTRLNAELEAMIKARKRDLERISWLQRRISDYERIVLDDRRIKQRAQDKAYKKLNENRKAVKIQAWWRGIMVKKWLGSYQKLFSDLYEYKAMKAALKANKKGRFKPKK